MDIIRGNYESTRTIHPNSNSSKSIQGLGKPKGNNASTRKRIEEVAMAALIVVTGFALYWLAAAAVYAIG